jgi:hypothetical protein
VANEPDNSVAAGWFGGLYRLFKGPPRVADSTGSSAGDHSQSTTPARIGHYAIARKLGAGGMGVVYEAHDERLDRRVALKMMLSLQNDETARKRFWREARAAASVNHPNVCQIYEVGEDGGHMFIAMELLEGEALAESLSRGPLSVDQVGGKPMKTLAREQDKAEILRRLAVLRRDTAGRWGRMSAHQMVCHLSDGCRLLTGDRTTRPAASPLPRPVMKWIALYLPMRWPAGILTTPELDQDVGGTRPAVDADVAELGRLLERIGTDRRGRLAGYVHPLFGRMSESAWLRWAYLHADHHLRQFGV